MMSLPNIDSLPDNPKVLRDVIRQAASEIKKLSDENVWLRELIAARNRRLFGRKSEKLDYEELQYWMFNEAEMGADACKAATEDKDDTETVTITRKKRGKKGRKPISDNLPRKVIDHDLPDEKKTCPCCGKGRPPLKPEVVEKVGYIPAQVFVNHHVYHKYGPCKCSESKKAGTEPIVSAPREKSIIPGGRAEPSLLAYLVTSKFCDGLPFYRQEKILTRHGIEYRRATMCNQMIGVSRALQDLTELMWKDLLGGEVIRMDETHLQVLSEPGRKATEKSWMHVAIGGCDEKRIILFHYHQNRTADIPRKILSGWSGYLQTDGLAAYNSAGEQQGIIPVGCWSHTRRKFIDARGGPNAPPGGLADEALSMIGELFKIENRLRKKSSSDREFVKRRKKLVKPVLKKLKDWIHQYIPQVPLRSFLGQAMNYTVNQWAKLVRYLDHAELRPDNNIAENAIRPFVIGRKNWMFSETPMGAHASATLYSFVESTKVNGLEPYEYFKYLFAVLPNTPRERLGDLLPHRIDPKVLAAG